MNSPAIDVKNMLENGASLGLKFGENLFVGYEPAFPDVCVTVLDVSGWPSRMSLDRDESYRYDGVQVRVRDRSYQAGWDMISKIADSIHGRNHEVWGDSYYHLIRIVASPQFLGWDNNGRCQFAVTFELQRSKAE